MKPYSSQNLSVAGDDGSWQFMTMALLNYVCAAIPLLLPGLYLIDLLNDPIVVARRWLRWLVSSHHRQEDSSMSIPPVSSQLLAYLGIGVFGFILTNKLVPHIKEYTLRKGICGKDLGKRGTSLAEKPL
jgi:hypothetical protein